MNPDVVIGISQWSLVAALLFSVFLSGDRMYVTGPITAIALTVMAATFISMEFWNATAPCMTAALCWYVISYRALRRRRLYLASVESEDGEL
jgi:hypothetical protein